MVKKKEVNNKNWKYPKRVFYVFLFCVIILYIQFAYLSLSPNIYGKNMQQFARNRDTAKVILKANRGYIYDNASNVLALNVTSYTVIAYLDPKRTTNKKYPMHVVDKEKTATLLAPVLSMDKEKILTLLNKKNVYQVELGPGGRGISELKKEEVENLGLNGIDFIENTKRYYPNGDFASYILGYAKTYQVKVDTQTGKEVSEKELEDEDRNYSVKTVEKVIGELGIEQKYNNKLQGQDGYLIYQRDKYGYKIPDTKEERVDAKNGSDIYLTIDSNIQRFVESAIKEQAAIYTPEWMMLAVMDAKTGDILAVSSSPSFDPNLRNITNYENPLTSYVFEPGSTMKTYTYMCAMEKGTYQGNQIYETGSYKIGDSIIQDWNNGKGWGKIKIDKGYEYSSTVGAVTIVNKFINKSDLKTCLNKYGFGKVTGIELPREFPGSIKFNYPVEVAAASYGHGITTTPIQHLQGLTLIANNGKMLKPHIIKKIVSNDKIIYQRKIEESEQIISKNTVNKMKELMYNTVHNRDVGATSGILYDIPGFEVIGKTGTAQIYDAKNGGYLKGEQNYIHSISLMYPKENPEIIIYGAIKKPSSGQGTSIATATTSVMKSIAKYKSMFEHNEKSNINTSYQMPSCINKNQETIKKELEAKTMEVVVIGAGDKIISAYPSAGKTLVIKDKVILLTNSAKKIMIDLTGWSYIDAINYSKLMGLKVSTKGYGYVTEQSIKSNEETKDNQELILTFSDKYDINEETKEKEKTE